MCPRGLHQMLGESQQGHQQTGEPSLARLQLSSSKQYSWAGEQGEGRRGGREGADEFSPFSSAMESGEGFT